MGWHLGSDVGQFARLAGALLAARPVENTVALTVTDRLLSGRHRTQAPPVLGWYALEGTVTGAVVLTPPRALLLAEVPDGTVEELVTVLTEHGTPLPGVTGEVETVDSFVDAWTARHGVHARIAMHQRLYRLEQLRTPTATPGRARVAGPADVDLVVDWFDRFEAEALPGGPSGDSRPLVRDRVEAGLLWLWEDGGEVVSLACRTVTVAGVARVAPVWTPPVLRRRGHGAAVTAAVTQDALARGAVDVVLFTDLANPTSNDIYQQVGFRPAGDHRLVDLGSPTT